MARSLRSNPSVAQIREQSGTICARRAKQSARVEGRHAHGRTITITKNEILTALNKPEDFLLAIVLVDGERVEEPSYVGRPFGREPDFGVTCVTYNLDELLSRQGAR